MKKALFVVIFAYLLAGLLFYIVFFGRMAQENDIVDQVTTGFMAIFALIVAIIATYAYIKAYKALKELPPENSPEFKEACLKEDIIIEILSLENPNVDFSLKHMTLQKLLDDYRIEERFGNKSVSELREIRNKLKNQQK